jgi:hypothetical protein
VQALWQEIGTLSSVVMALAALAALVYAHLQIGEGRRAERRADANELWRETVRLDLTVRGNERRKASVNLSDAVVAGSFSNL